MAATGEAGTPRRKCPTELALPPEPTLGSLWQTGKSLFGGRSILWCLSTKRRQLKVPGSPVAPVAYPDIGQPRTADQSQRARGGHSSTRRSLGDSSILHRDLQQDVAALPVTWIRPASLRLGPAPRARASRSPPPHCTLHSSQPLWVQRNRESCGFSGSLWFSAVWFTGMVYS